MKCILCQFLKARFGIGIKDWGTTEGCSFVSDMNFRECCDAHDKRYLDKDITREEADNELYECIKNKGHPFLAWVYWATVRVIGGAFW